MGEIVELKTPGPDVISPALTEAFGDLCRRVIELSRITEEYFLTFGKQVQEYSDRTSKITGMALDASSTMSGDDIRSAIEGLEGMVGQLESIFNRVDSVSSSNQELLRSVGRSLRSVEKDLADLGGTSRDLKMLALSTKVHSTRTGSGSSAFMQLGHDIARISTTISSKTSDLFNETGTLSGFVQSVQATLQDLKEKQKFQTENVLSGTRSIIASMADQRFKSIQEAERIRKSSEEIALGVSQMVTSVQYQDITRQCLDRVVEDLGTILDKACTGKPDDDAASEIPSVSPEISIVGQCLQQVDRLERSDLVIHEALEKMVHSLSEITENIQKMGAVTKAANQDSADFLMDLQTAISSVTSLIEEVVQSGREMSDSMNSLAHTVAAMSGFTGDIEMMSSDVELISLNARIMAAQTGIGGAGMSVIAAAVQETARNSEEQRSSVVGKLEEVRRASLKLKGEVEGATGSEEVKPDQLVRELGVFLDALRGIQRKVVSILNDIDNMSRELVRDLEATTGEIRDHMAMEFRSTDIAMDLKSLALDCIGSVEPADLNLISDTRYRLEELQGMGPKDRMEIVKAFYNRQGDRGSSREVSTPSSDEGDITIFVEESGKGAQE